MRTLCFIVLLCTSFTVHAEPFRDGIVAYQQEKYQQALNIWLPLAKNGHVLAQTLVGSMYANGEGIERNDQAAFKWLSLAANTGSAQAQYNLGILYEKGFGTSTDKVQAQKWFKAAADQGRKDAAARYALLEDTTTVNTTSQPIIGVKELVFQTTPPERNTIATTNSTPVIEHNATRQRIHMVLNKNDNELLGPPAHAIEATAGINVDKYGLAWARQQPRENYTIQLASSVEPRLINEFKTRLKLTKHYAKTIFEHNDYQWYALIYGSYASVSDAKKAMDKLPASWKTWQPWIKRFPSVSAIKH